MPELHIDQNLAAASTLPSRYYTDPNFLLIEEEKIFARTWQLVAFAEQLAEPGSYVTAQVGREPVLLVR
jgi:choline monooxygenase